MNLLLCSLMILGSFASASDLEVKADGPDSRGIFTVQGEFEVEASTSAAWNVLTDYNHMAEFLYPAVTTSKIKEQEDNRLYVNQTFVARVLFFDRSADVLFEVMLTPELGVINFRDILRTDFDLCEGMWSILPTPYGSDVRYTVRLIPHESGPNFIVRRVSRKMAAALLTQLQAEMERRK